MANLDSKNAVLRLTLSTSSHSSTEVLLGGAVALDAHAVHHHPEWSTRTGQRRGAVWPPRVG